MAHLAFGDSPSGAERSSTFRAMTTGGKAGRWLALVGVVTILAGLLFGYDQGVISGELPLLTDHF